jgi:Kef-type K+ transport system membrane component KefB
MTETWRASWRAGVAMSTTSVAAVYALMLEFGLNVTSYGTLLMATGLIFGTISALSALSHGVITRAQYSALVAAVVASAVVPTLIANACFLPRHLLRPSVASETEAVIAQSRQHYQNALRGVQSKRQVIAYAHCAVTVVRQPTS